MLFLLSVFLIVLFNNIFVFINCPKYMRIQLMCHRKKVTFKVVVCTLISIIKNLLLVSKIIYMRNCCSSVRPFFCLSKKRNGTNVNFF